MNKQVYMESMTSASETIMKLGITGDVQKNHEESLVIKAVALAEKDAVTKAEKKAKKDDLSEEDTKVFIDSAVEAAGKEAKEKAEAVPTWGEAICKKAEEAFGRNATCLMPVPRSSAVFIRTDSIFSR